MHDNRRMSLLSIDDGSNYSTSSSSSAPGSAGGFMLKLDIFAGRFQNFYFQIDNSCSLLCFGPLSSNTPQEEYVDVSRSKANSMLNLIEVYKIRPYDGSIKKPRRHFCFELLSDSAKWVLAVPSVDQFASWMKRFHRASPRLMPVSYNIYHDKYSWSIGNEQPSEQQQQKKNNKNGKNSKIKDFKAVLFTETQFGMQLTSCPDGTVVHSVSEGGAANMKGVSAGDFVVSVNDKSVVGYPWREVKKVIMQARRPIKITFGKPISMKAKSSGSPESVSSGLALRRRFGPYIYGLKRRIQGFTTSSSAVEDSNLMVTSPKWFPASPINNPTQNSLDSRVTDVNRNKKTPPIAPPRNRGNARRKGSFFATFKRNLSSRLTSPNTPFNEDERDMERASIAASTQLSRYRGVQSRLYSAIQASHEHEEQVQNLLNGILDQAKSNIEPAKKKKTRVMNSYIQNTKHRETSMITELKESLNDKQPHRHVVATSSRLTTNNISQERVGRIQKVMAKSRKQISKDAYNAWAYVCNIIHICLSSVMRERQRIEALMDLARSEELNDREDAFDAMLDFASSSSRLDLLVELGIVPLIIESLDRKESIVIIENVAGICWNLSDLPLAAMELINAGVVSRLIRLLECEANDEDSSDIAKEESAGCLWSLCESFDCKSEFLRYNGIDTVLNLITEDSGSTEFMFENCTGILWLLLHDPDCLHEVMRKRSNVDPVACFTRLVTKGTIVSQENSSGSLLRITLDRRYRKQVRDSPGAITALVQVLAFGTILSRENGAGALHNIALDDDKTQRLIAVEGAIPPLSRLLQSQFPASTRSRAALCLRTLAQNKQNKKEISSLGCIDELVKILKCGETEAMLQIHILEALWGLGHEDDANKRYITQSGVLPKIVNILKNGDEQAKIRAAGLVGSLSEGEMNGDLIVKSGALDPLIGMVMEQQMNSSKRDSQREAATALGNLSRGSQDVQKKLMQKLSKFEDFHNKKDRSSDIQQVRTKLCEIEMDVEQEFI